MENLKGQDRSLDLDVNGKRVLKLILKKYARGGGVVWIHLAQDKDQWRVLVNTAMNLRVP
jgi:hypothetical protein